MKSSITNQAERFLREHKNKRRYGALLLALAVVVAVGTVAVVRHTGVAMTHTERVLECPLEVHKHTEACYATEDGQRTLVCGQANYVVHTHNSD